MRIIHSLKRIVYFLPIFVAITCQRSHPSEFWPNSERHFNNLSWAIPVADSLNVIQKIEDVWILPDPDDQLHVGKTQSLHRFPTSSKFKEYLGNVDQEVVQNNARNQMEFYRFEDGGVCLLGYTTPDSSRSLIFYAPPLVLFPDSMKYVPNVYKSSSIEKTLNLETGQVIEGQKCRIVLNMKDKGFVLLDSCQVPALLCDMSFFIDRTIGYGDRNLIVPDAVMIKNSMIIAEGVGPVLEWGVRSRKMQTPEDRLNPMSVAGPEEREFYIEVTMHIPVDKPELM